jgi:hypothetical protein
MVRSEMSTRLQGGRRQAQRTPDLSMQSGKPGINFMKFKIIVVNFRRICYHIFAEQVIRCCKVFQLDYDKTRRYWTLPDLVAGGFLFYGRHGIL